MHPNQSLLLPDTVAAPLGQKLMALEKDSERLAAARKKLKKAMNFGSLLQRLDSLAFMKFPIVMSDTIGGVITTIAFDKLELYPEYAEVEVLLGMKLPQRTVSATLGQPKTSAIHATTPINIKKYNLKYTMTNFTAEKLKQLLLEGEIDSALKIVENLKVSIGYDPRYLIMLRVQVNQLLSSKDRLEPSVYIEEFKRLVKAIARIASITLPNELIFPIKQQVDAPSIDISEEFETLRNILKSISLQVPDEKLQPSINSIRRLERLRLDRIASDKECLQQVARLQMVINLLKERYPEQASQDSNPTLPLGYTLEEQKQRLMNLQEEHPELVTETAFLINAIELLHERLRTDGIKVSDYLVQGARIDQEIERLLLKT